MTQEFDLKTHAEMMIKKSVDRRRKAILDYRKSLKLEDSVPDNQVIMLAKIAKVKVPKVWSDKQARCVLYWQNGVRSNLKKKAEEALRIIPSGIILDIPEANGIFVIPTMAKVGVNINIHHPDIVIKVMLVGKPKVN